MAIWHFVVSLVPRAGVIRIHGEIPKVLEQYRVRIGDSRVVIVE